MRRGPTDLAAQDRPDAPQARSGGARRASLAAATAAAVLAAAALLSVRVEVRIAADTPDASICADRRCHAIIF